MTIWFGGDYNPEQWPRDVWDEDIALMLRAGVTVVTVAVFSWAWLEPEEGRFEFEWLDDVLDRLHAGGIGVDLATATASPPPWVAHRYPDTLPVLSNGTVLSGGSRQQYSPHSATFRRLAESLVRAVVDRYSDHPAVVAWHVSNEYGCHLSHCYSDEGAAAFRIWLERRYGSIEALNAAWGTTFWSQRYGSFDEVYPPRDSPTFINPTQLIDFDRFSSDALLELFLMEKAVIRERSELPVTTNFIGAFKAVDYWRWAREVDVVSDDSYPDPADPDSPVLAAMSRDLMRSLRGGQPWILMEQATNAVNWRPRNARKTPGVNRALSLQALARGADGIMYFQWRQSTSGAEKFHSAMLPHGGADTRIFREVEQLGAELGALAWIEGDTVRAQVAILFDWDSWWAIEQRATPTQLAYPDLVRDWYRGFWDLGITVDFVRPGDDLGAYALVVAASTFVLDDEARAHLAAAAGSSRLLVTFQTAILDRDLHITAGGYLGELQQTLGVVVEEFAPLAPADPHGLGQGEAPGTAIDGELGSFGATLWQEIVRVVDAEVVMSFAVGDAAGEPAVTRKGDAWYVATQPDRAGIRAILNAVLADSGVERLLDEPVDGVEAVRRGDATFVINHRGEERTASVAGAALALAPREVRVLR
ncbi:beta-galactosidase [Amnibacterium flavum]|uniref:Beta-galactosidase n=1 Tax=Amnibacterium flavum TaxID=2173173 RepID=A0A2V1HU19_9MICO|nr:beta-galactosidase [Amnibacterium flavum]PVZ96105.1 beta-galactosidase [Amnibacterium flavum]